MFLVPLNGFFFADVQVSPCPAGRIVRAEARNDNKSVGCHATKVGSSSKPICRPLGFSYIHYKISTFIKPHIFRMHHENKMKYEKIPPPGYLNRYVQYFWAYESKRMAGPPKTFRPITDGCPGIIIQVSESDPLFDQDKKQLPALCLYGQTIRHREIHAREQFRVIGVCFSPIGLKSIFGLNANLLTDSCTDLRSLPGQQALFLSEQVASTDSISRQIELLSTYLLTQIRRNNAQPNHVTSYALTQLVSSEGTISMRELQDRLNISERHLERKFKEEVGISPKLFSRICRFQASFQQLKTNKYDKLSDIAFENGYADQSHFIRVFKEFAGFPPNRYGKQSAEIVENLAEWF